MTLQHVWPVPVLLLNPCNVALQVFLAVLLSRFRLQLAPSMGTPQQAMDSLIYHITFKAGNGMWVTAEAR